MQNLRNMKTLQSHLVHTYLVLISAALEKLLNHLLKLLCSILFMTKHTIQKTQIDWTSYSM